MKRKLGLFTAAALSASMVLTSAAPALAAEPVTEAAEEAGEAAGEEAGGTEDLPLSEELPGEDGGLGALEQFAGKAVKVQSEVEFGDLFRQLMSQAAEGEDMSWLQKVTMDESVAVGEDKSIDAAINYGLNDTPLYDVQASFDASDLTLYLCIPQLKEEPFALNIGDLIQKMMEESGDDIQNTMDTLDISEEDLQRMAEEAEELFGSISEEEIDAFAERYAEPVQNAFTITDAGSGQITAGDLSADASLATIAVQPQDMDTMVQTCAANLRDDELILKVVGSDLAADLVSTIGSAEDPSSAAITGEQLVAAYQQFFDQNKDSLTGLPGFSVTYGEDEQGNAHSLTFKILYSGVEMPVFTYAGINDGTKNAYEFNLGEMIASAILSSDSTSGQETQPAGKTGLLLEGNVSGGKLNETATVQVSGQAAFAMQFADWDVEKFKNDQLDGNIETTIEGMSIRLAFESAAPDTQAISVLLNEEQLLTATMAQSEIDPSEVSKIDKASAVEIHSNEDMSAYLEDADPTKLVDGLKTAGVPQEIIDEILSDTEDGAAGETGSTEGLIEPDADTADSEAAEDNVA